jgi:hypothetical protein
MNRKYGWQAKVGVALAVFGLFCPPAPAKPAPAGKSKLSEDEIRLAVEAIRPLQFSTLSNPALLKEIKCSKEQSRTLLEKIKIVEAQQQKAWEALAFKKEGGIGNEDLAKAEAAVQKLRSDICKTLLKPAQVIRLTEIALQAQGPVALRMPPVAKTLKLKDIQKAKLRSIYWGYVQELNPIFIRAKMNTGELNFKDVQALQAKTVANCVAVLNKDQQARWKKLSGKPFPVGQLKVWPIFNDPDPMPNQVFPKK